jgi:putative glutamine amidotransferase
MQLMSLLAGGAMDQYMPETMGDGAAAHYGKEHGLVVAEGLSVLRGGNVHSHHRQRITDAGRLRVLATAADGVIEAVGDPARPFYVGVQWHPERTVDAACGIDVFRAMMAAVRRA